MEAIGHWIKTNPWAILVGFVAALVTLVWAGVTL